MKFLLPLLLLVGCLLDPIPRAAPTDEKGDTTEPVTRPAGMPPIEPVEPLLK